MDKLAQLTELKEQIKNSRMVDYLSKVKKTKEIDEEIEKLETLMQKKVKQNFIDYAGLNKGEQSI